MNSSVTKPAPPKSLPKKVFNNQPIPGKKFTQPQSQYDNVPEAPFRQILYANTSSGKTTLILNQCLDLYQNNEKKIQFLSASLCSAIPGIQTRRGSHSKNIWRKRNGTSRNVGFQVIAMPSWKK